MCVDNAKVDVYAFSMILFELLEGKARCQYRPLLEQTSDET